MEEILKKMQSLSRDELNMYMLGLIEGMVTGASEKNAYRVIEEIRNVYDIYDQLKQK